MRIAKIAATFILAAAVVLGFGLSVSAAPQLGSVTLSPSSFNFGTLTVGGPAKAYPFILSNSTAASVAVTSAAIAPADARSYTVQNLCGATLPAGASCDIWVTFAPVNAGAKNFMLQVATSAGTLSASLTGVGTLSPLSFNPPSLAFGNAAVGASSTMTSVLSNTSQFTYLISSISVSSNSESYKETNNCNSQIVPGESCTIIITYTPVSAGVKDYAINVVYNGSTVSLPLTATATGLLFAPASLAFGQQPVGVPATKSVTVTNTSQAPITIQSIGTTPGKQSYSATNNCPPMLGARANCTVQVTFSPTSEGVKNYQLIVADSAGTQALNLTGSAQQPSVIVSPSDGVSFGSQPLGQSASQNVFVSNIGGAAVTISSIALTPSGSQSYTLSNQCPSSLDRNQTCVVTVSFDPVSVGRKDYSLQVTTSAAVLTIPLQGVGVQLSLPNLAYAPPATVPSNIGIGRGTFVVADFNGDGKPDFAIGASLSSVASVFLSNGDGTFRQAPQISLSNAWGVTGVVSGDFNNDGKQDLLVGGAPGPYEVDYLLLGNGDGSFQTPITVLGTIGFYAAAVGDFNGDGKVDYVEGTGTGTLAYHQGNGDGTFQPEVDLFDVGNPVTGLVVGDFSGDNKLDIVAIYPPYNGVATLEVILGNGDGTFQQARPQPLENEYIGKLQTADFNQDGKLDLLIDYQGSAEIAYGDGAGHFKVGGGNYGYGVLAYRSSQNEAQDIVISTLADFDGDGKPDAVFGDYLLGDLNIVLNRGLGIMPAPLNTSMMIPLAPKTDDIAVADFNGDGIPDIVTYSSTTETLSIFLSQKPQ